MEGLDHVRRMEKFEGSDLVRKSHKNVQVHIRSKELGFGNGTRHSGEISSKSIKLHWGNKWAKVN